MTKMHLWVVFPIALILISTGALSASAKDFQGIIQVVSGDPSLKETIDGKETIGSEKSVLSIKANKLRLERPQGTFADMVTLVDFDAGKILILLPKQKMYLELGFDQFKQLSGPALEAARKIGIEAPAEPAPVAQTIAVSKTDRKETLAGRSCEIFSFNQGTNTGEIWVIPEIANIFQKLVHAIGSEHLIAADYSAAFDKITGMPAKIVDTTNKQTTVLFEVKSIEEKELDPTLFSPPEGFTKIAMPEPSSK